MKIGFWAGKYESIAYIIHALQYAERINTSPTEFNFFSLSLKGDEYYFLNNATPQQLNKLDKIFICEHTTISSEPRVRYDARIFSTPGEPIYYDAEYLKNFLSNPKNIVYSGSTISDDVIFEHDNFVYNEFINFSFFYRNLGFKFLNFYKNNTNKLNLLGVYYRVDNGDRFPGLNPRKIRAELINQIDEKYPNLLHRYKSHEDLLDTVLNTYHSIGMGQWAKNHITSYTDYTTSVCNILFESETPVEEGKINFTEKTLKGLLFSAENIFFIWVGYSELYYKLKKSGFWFLNFEFMHEDTPDFINKSVTRTVYFLTKLKLNDGLTLSNNEVHEKLLNMYGHRLESNYKLLKKFLNECPESEKVINLLKR